MSRRGGNSATSAFGNRVCPVSQIEHLFSDGYRQARDRFREKIRECDAELYSFPVDAGDDLTIDVGIIGNKGARRAVVVSSGIHGVEAPLGSAIQLASLDQTPGHKLPPDIRLVHVHSVNPFGFANHRRCNEENVDLNRNFFDQQSEFHGVPDRYAELDLLLNPPSPPSRFEPFRLKALMHIAKLGLPAVKQAVASGQYEFPQGLFFGGKSKSRSTEIIQQNLAEWIGDAPEIMHLDLHSGLGRFAEVRLLLEHEKDSTESQRFNNLFGPEIVEPNATAKGTAYAARGTFGSWAVKHFHDRDYSFATAEFGTYGVLRVLAALRAENRVFQHGASRNDYAWVNQEFRECFCPASPAWRGRVVQTGTELISKCLESQCIEAQCIESH